MIDSLTITVLVEDRSDDPGLRAEAGLALWIEADDARILLDTGAGAALEHNAQHLGIDLMRADALVLSHGHDDHSGGVAALLEQRPELLVCFHPDALRSRYSHRGGRPHAIGMPVAAAVLLAGRDRRRDRHDLTPDLWCTGEISRPLDGPPLDPFLVWDAAGTRHDPVPDDQSLVIRHRHGLVVCCGCCHAGVGPTLHQVRAQAPGEAIQAVVGGLHLKAADEAGCQRAAEELAAAGVQRLCIGHCTGSRGEAVLGDRFGEHCTTVRVGSRLRFSAADPASGTPGPSPRSHQRPEG